MMLHAYPFVREEYATIRAVLDGKSLARFGDGELKMMQGGEYKREPANASMASELKNVITFRHPAIIVGIPTMDLAGPKGKNWLRHEERFMQELVSHMEYYSAFVSRPDSAPWINHVGYALLVERLWARKTVVLLAEERSSLYNAMSISAKRVHHIACPHAQAYSQIAAFEDDIIHKGIDTVVLSAGPTATCLAFRLALKGIHAVDLGSAGGFLNKLLRTVHK